MVRVGPRKVGNLGIREVKHPLTIGKKSIMTFKDESTLITVSFIDLGIIAFFEA